MLGGKLFLSAPSQKENVIANTPFVKGECSMAITPSSSLGSSKEGRIGVLSLPYSLCFLPWGWGSRRVNKEAVLCSVWYRDFSLVSLNIYGTVGLLYGPKFMLCVG